MSVNLDPLMQQVIVDKGRDDGAFIGQPILDAYGVFGQIIQVGNKHSIVALLSDEQHAIPVEDMRNHIRGVVVGNGPNASMRLLHITSTHDVKVGDQLNSSGLGGRFPVGYHVGQVAHISQGQDGQFMEVTITPSAHIHQSRQVLLVWQGQSSTKINARKALSRQKRSS